MNELALLTDAELDKRIAEVEKREEAIKTEKGQRVVISRIRAIFKNLSDIGYSTYDMDEYQTAVMWATTLQEYFVKIGTTGIEQAVMNWCQKDESSSRQFPKVAWIVEECRKIGGDPRAEKGRREQARREQALEEESAREFREWKENHPEEAKRIEERARKCICG